MIHFLELQAVASNATLCGPPTFPASVVAAVDEESDACRRRDESRGLISSQGRRNARLQRAPHTHIHKARANRHCPVTGVMGAAAVSAAVRRTGCNSARTVAQFLNAPHEAAEVMCESMSHVPRRGLRRQRTLVQVPSPARTSCAPSSAGPPPATAPGELPSGPRTRALHDRGVRELHEDVLSADTNRLRVTRLGTARGPCRRPPRRRHGLLLTRSAGWLRKVLGYPLAVASLHLH